VASELGAALSKGTDDSNSDVRDACLSALGVLKGRMGDAAMSKLIQDMNPQKLIKVNESAATVKPSKYDRPEKPPEKKAPPPSKKPAPKKKPVEEVKEQPMEDVVMNEPSSASKPGEELVMTFEEKPKRAPPARLQRKVEKTDEEEKVDGGDTEMRDEQEEVKQAPAKKPPPKKEAPKKPEAKPATKAPPTGGPKAPQIQEEDLGSGFSKEEAEAKVQELFNPETVKLFEEAKWQDKQKGFQSLA